MMMTMMFGKRMIILIAARTTPGFSLTKKSPRIMTVLLERATAFKKRHLHLGVDSPTKRALHVSPIPSYRHGLLRSFPWLHFKKR